MGLRTLVAIYSPRHALCATLMWSAGQSNIPGDELLEGVLFVQKFMGVS
jgi:hypothetical protein